MSDFLNPKIGDVWLSTEKPGVKRTVKELNARNVYYVTQTGGQRVCSRRQFIMWLSQSGAYNTRRSQCGCIEDAEACKCGGACNCH